MSMINQTNCLHQWEGGQRIQKITQASDLIPLFIYIKIKMDINELYFIGSNTYGQSGAGQKNKNKQYNQPTSILFPIFIKQVSCGHHHSALLTIDGNVYTMGSNINGTLAQPLSQVNYSFSPILVPNLKEVNKISSGAFHICAISEGSLYSWGKGIDGQLGNRENSNSYQPKKIQSLGSDVEDVSCGQNHTLVRGSNHCYAFGNGIYGQLGINSNKNSNEPVRVHIFDVEDIAAGQNHSLFVSNGEVFGCGQNKLGQTGTGFVKKYILQPKSTGLKNVAMIKAGKISAAITNNGELHIWGGNLTRANPLKVPNFNENIMDIRVGSERLYCLTSNGELFDFNLKNKNNEEIKVEKINISTTTILDFSIGDSHSLILGDIVGQASLQESTMKVLLNMNQKHESLKQFSPKSMSEQYSNSINSEHFAKTPSSIMKEPNNFLKSQSKVKVNEFNKVDEVDVIMKKVEKIMNMLEKNSKMEEQQTERTEKDSYCLKKVSQTGFHNKENTLSYSNQQTSRTSNRKLIMELRQKQLKISELQDKLSRKDMEIQSQKQLIKLMTKLNKNGN